MLSLHRFALTSIVVAVAVLTAGQDATAQQPGAVSVTAGSSAPLDALRQWDAAVDSMNRNRELVVTSRVEDRALPGRTHEYLAQVVDGVPLLGAGVARQLDASGVTISLLGALHPGIDVDTTPSLSAAEVAARLEQGQAGRLVASRRPALVVLPLPEGAYALAYRVAMSDGRYHFVDADDGRVLHVADAFLRQSAVGGGSDARGRRRKLGTTRDGARYQAHDRLRPAEIITLDGRFDFLRIDRLLLGHFIDELPPGAPVWNTNDVAADSDNEWEDPAVVEAHVHTGWTYDYLYARHGWRGLDGADGRIFSIVNVDFGGPNAIAAPPPFGPEGTGVYVYGRVSDGMREEPLSSLDVVAHELMHGVTHFAVSRRTGDPAGLVGGFPPNTRLGPESVTDDRGRTFTCDSDFSGAWTAGSSWAPTRPAPSTRPTPTSWASRSGSSTKTTAPPPTTSRAATRPSARSARSPTPDRSASSAASTIPIRTPTVAATSSPSREVSRPRTPKAPGPGERTRCCGTTRAWCS